MNIYTLKFNEKDLENSYQEHKANYLQFPILKFSYFLSIIIIGCNLIEKIVNNNYIQFIPKLIILILIIGQCVFFQYFRRFPNFSIFLVNFLLICLETEVNSFKNSFDGYLFGSNQMLAHTTLTMGLDFIFGVSANICLGVIRAVITYYNTDILTVQQHLYTIIITVGFSGIVYQYEKYQRSSYLFQEKDTKWGIYMNILEKILPHVICKPFLIFTFDKEGFSFQQIAINKSLTESQEMQFDSVSEFLKECKYEKKTLQQYLFNKYETFNSFLSQIECEKLELLYRKSRLRIKLLIYCVDTIRFMIVVEAVDQAYIDLKSKYCNQLKSIDVRFNNQLKKITKLLDKRLRGSFPQLLIDLRISIFEFKLFSSITKTKAIDVNINHIFRKFNQIFQQSYKYSIKFICLSNLSLQTYKPELYIFLLSIIKNIKPQQSAELILGADQLPKDRQFIYCTNLIFEKHITFVNCIIFLQPSSFLDFQNCKYTFHFGLYNRQHVK